MDRSGADIKAGRSAMKFLKLAAWLLMLRVGWTTLPPLPVSVSNNAVASLHVEGRDLLFSFLGMGEGKDFRSITRNAWILDTRAGQWMPLPPVPGSRGRLAASAAGVNNRIFLFGGYTVDADGYEVSLSNVDILNVHTRRWSRGANIPVPIDDSVIGVYHERYVFLISGWSQSDNVHNVQIYDTVENRWQQGTPIPGTAVFGHSGSLLENTIVYVDGAYINPSSRQKPSAQLTGTKPLPRYITSEECWLGRINANDPKQIQWSRLPPHPGTSRYRMGAGAAKGRIVFSGGTDNPYNYNGIGYNGKPSEPVATIFAWNLQKSAWEVLPDNEKPSMDHRGMVHIAQGLVVIGGMEKGQRVSSRVSILKFKP